MDRTRQEQRKNNSKSQVMYGISRIDNDRFRTHAWRVKLVRRGKAHIKNFPDKRWCGKHKALVQAKAFRDELLKNHPPISRQDFCSVVRSNNQSVVSGVCRYAKSFTLKNGKTQENWYWEATWPIGEGQQSHRAFPVNEHGEAAAKRLAIRTREEELEKIDGHFWASSRGVTA